MSLELAVFLLERKVRKLEILCRQLLCAEHVWDKIADWTYFGVICKKCLKTHTAPHDQFGKIDMPPKDR